MPEVTGYSREMVERGLDVLRSLLSREMGEARLACLGDRRALDRTVRTGRRRASRALPLGSICCVAAGNIYIGSIDALVLALITKNAGVLKISRSDPVFPFLFLEALEEADPERIVLPSVGVAAWSRSNREVIAHVKESFDAILLFGGAEAVAEWKRDLGPRTELLAFGPKVSFGVLRKGLSEEKRREAARGFARDAILWEQRACTSCQNVLVEGGEEERDAFAAMLAEALEEACVALPAGSPDLDEAVEIRKERELGFLEEVRGRGRLFEGRGWTVIARGSGGYVPSPLNRTVYAVAFRDLAELEGSNLSALGQGMLSTAGIAAPEDRTTRPRRPSSAWAWSGSACPGPWGWAPTRRGPTTGAASRSCWSACGTWRTSPGSPWGPTGRRPPIGSRAWSPGWTACSTRPDGAPSMPPASPASPARCPPWRPSPGPCRSWRSRTWRTTLPSRTRPC
jgi:hypothetical protein